MNIHKFESILPSPLQSAEYKFTKKIENLLDLVTIELGENKPVLEILLNHIEYLIDYAPRSLKHVDLILYILRLDRDKLGLLKDTDHDTYHCYSTSSVIQAKVIVEDLKYIINLINKTWEESN